MPLFGKFRLRSLTGLFNWIIKIIKVGGKQKPYEMWQAGISLAASPLANSLAGFARERMGSLSARVFETATGREQFAFLDRIVSQIFILFISNGEKIHSNVNAAV